MTRQTLIQHIKDKRSFLCVGLDTDITKIPEHLLGEEDPIFTFNKAIIEATEDLCVAYKPNIAFYEAMASKAGNPYRKHGRLYLPPVLALPMPREAISAIRLKCMPRPFLTRPCPE